MNDVQRYSLQMLNEHHPVNRFVCEDDLFSEYLRDEALYDMENGFALTFVEVDPNLPNTENIAGFFTLRAHAALIRDEYGEVDEDGSAPEDIEVPLIELMYLARDIRWKRQRMGDYLMLDALSLITKISLCVGFIGVHLRSTGDGTKLYARHRFQLFEQHRNADGLRYILPISVIREIEDDRQE